VATRTVSKKLPEVANTMDDASLELASLLCSRLCHDLLSPVGALTNGIELLAEEKDPEMRKRCFELLEQSARISADKLKFFRLAFGAAGGFGEMVPIAEPRALINALVGNNGRITANWALAGDVLPKPAVKTLLNLSLIAIEALIRGGTLDIGAEMREGASEIVVRAAGTRIAFDNEVGLALNGQLPISALTSRTAPAAMLYQLASSVGGGLQFALTDEALVMGAVLPVV
jgi:histidine phosphotransferase ChpT